MTTAITIATILLGPLIVIVAAIWNTSLIEDEPAMLPELTDEGFRELTEIRLRYFQRSEQAEADAARACEILGIDPAADTCERDWAEELALTGAHVVPTIGRISKWRAMR